MILPGTRIRDNGVFGVTLNNPLSAGATSMSSVQLSELGPIGSGTEHAIITLDPLKEHGDPEIVMVTLHTASGVAATIQRGMYGTVPRSHPQGTLWVHAAVDEDFIEVVTSTNRPADPYEGQFIYETDTKEVRVFDGTDWVEFGGGGGGGGTFLAYAEVTANQAGLAGAGADLTGLSVTVTVPAGRRLRITGSVLYSNDTTDGRSVLTIIEGGTQLQFAALAHRTAGATAALSRSVIITPTAGTHTYKLNGAASVGTSTMVAAPTAPAFILVEDITADPSPVDPESVPVGQLAYAQVTANQTGITTSIVPLTGLSVNVAVESGRVLRITGKVNFAETVATVAVANLLVFEDGVQIQQSGLGDPAAQSESEVAVVIRSPSSGAHVYDLRAVTNAGTVSMVASSSIPAFILVEDITPTPAPSSGAPGSTLAYAQVTANQGSITSEVDLSGLSANITVPAGRRIRITGEINMSSSAVPETGDMKIFEDGVQIAGGAQTLSSVGVSNKSIVSVTRTPSAGSHTYKLRLGRVGATGTLTMAAGATFPAFILVEDITGSVWPEGSEVTAGMIASEAWTPWVPTHTNLTIGAGTITARYIKIGRTVFWRWRFALGAGSAVGAGPTLTLPIPAVNVGFPTDAAGTTLCHDAGVAHYPGLAIFDSSTVVSLKVGNASGTYVTLPPISATVPFTFGSGDDISAFGQYEAAF